MRIHLTEYLDATVQRVPDRVAVIDEDCTITFAALRQRCRRLSRTISTTVEGKIRHPIAVFLEKSIDGIVADIAILYSGNAYMNLDLKTPETRIAAILEQIQPALVITDTKHRSQLPEQIKEEQLFLLDQWTEETHASDTVDAQVEATLAPLIDTDPLCIINTSGSTGVPKGVLLSHRSFFDYMEWAKEATKIGEDEVVGCLSPVVFDHFSFELCLMMAQGATLVLLSRTLAAFPARLLQKTAEHSVSFVFWVPTIMVNIANMGLLEKVPQPALKTVWFAGEVFPTRQFNYWRKILPQVKFINLYGPAETTVDCTYYIVERELQDDEPIPIGHACRNADVMILNERDELCGPGEEGEICVRGTSLAMGYYNNPEKTAAAFVQNPLNHAYPERIYRTGDVAVVNERGEILFKGRRDTLIKHSGYRIELSEIEHVIVNTLKLVRNGCVVYDHAKKEIVFFYESESELPVAELRREISTAFPKYMVPSVYIWMSELPRNTNGKIDRLKLKEQVQNG